MPRRHALRAIHPTLPAEWCRSSTGEIGSAPWRKRSTDYRKRGNMQSLGPEQAFIVREVWTLAWAASVQRANLYVQGSKQTRKFRRKLRTSSRAICCSTTKPLALRSSTIRTFLSWWDLAHVLSLRASANGIEKDLNTLSLFRRAAGYERAITSSMEANVSIAFSHGSTGWRAAFRTCLSSRSGRTNRWADRLRIFSPSVGRDQISLADPRAPRLSRCAEAQKDVDRLGGWSREPLNIDTRCKPTFPRGLSRSCLRSRATILQP
jgi:hypothetical protein